MDITVRYVLSIIRYKALKEIARIRRQASTEWHIEIKGGCDDPADSLHTTGESSSILTWNK
jgi:hypothetical protein